MYQFCADAVIGGESYVRRPSSSLGGECQRTTSLLPLACPSGMFSAPCVPPLLLSLFMPRMYAFLVGYGLLVSMSRIMAFGNRLGGGSPSSLGDVHSNECAMQRTSYLVLDMLS